MDCKKLTLCLVGFVILGNILKSQVTIGSTNIPLPGAILDLKSEADGTSKKGLLLPRVELIHTKTLLPTADESIAGNSGTHTGLVVYNVVNRNDVCKGLYVWSGNEWVPFTPCNFDMASNSYLVKPNGISEEIPVAKPYLVWKKRADLASLEFDKLTLEQKKLSLSVLWQDTQDLIDPNGLNFIDGDRGWHSKFTVKTKSNGKVGNALVALHMGSNRNETDPIIWSWHIWVTDYNPDAPTGQDKIYSTTNGEGSYVFMDRNLGAVTYDLNSKGSIGLMYQWGRKDPFTGPKGYGDNEYDQYSNLYSVNNILLEETKTNGIKHIPIINNTDSNLSKTIQNPMTFYYHPEIRTEGDGYGDWYGYFGIKDNDLWGAVSGVKSVFDPCPKGWKVPANTSNYSPWQKYHGEGLGGWSNYEFNQFQNGVELISSGDTPYLGFYPKVSFRFGRATLAGGVVGGSGSQLPGGIFAYETIRPASAYWSSSAGSNGLAKAFTLEGGAGSFWPIMVSDTQQIDKATGAFVRCVKE